MFSHGPIWNWAFVEGQSCWHQHEGAPLWRPTLWAEQTHVHGSPHCVRARPLLCYPTPGLSPAIHKLPAQVTAVASPSSSSVTGPLASSSLFLQHSVDCLTHRKWQVNISCTEHICTWLLCCSCCCVPEMEPWVTASHSASSLPDPHPVNLSISSVKPTYKNILQCVGSGEHFSPNKQYTFTLLIVRAV